MGWGQRLQEVAVRRSYARQKGWGSVNVEAAQAVHTGSCRCDGCVCVCVIRFVTACTPHTGCHAHASTSWLVDTCWRRCMHILNDMATCRVSSSRGLGGCEPFCQRAHALTWLQMRTDAGLCLCLYTRINNNFCFQLFAFLRQTNPVLNANIEYSYR